MQVTSARLIFGTWLMPGGIFLQVLNFPKEREDRDVCWQTPPFPFLVKVEMNGGDLLMAALRCIFVILAK